MKERALGLMVTCIALVAVLSSAGIARAQCEIQSAKLLGSVETEYLASEIVASGSYAYMSTGEHYQAETALQVVDISDPMAPQVVGSVSLPDASIALAIADTYIYYLTYPGALFIIDVSDPSAPFVAGSIDMPSYSSGIAVSGSFAYVAVDFTGLRIVDVSNPSDPRIVGSVDEWWIFPMGVAVSGSHAYVATAYSLDIVDVSNPFAPRIVGSVDTSGTSWDAVIIEPYAYIGTDRGLEIADISDPSSAHIVSSVSMPSWLGAAYRLDVSGSYAYMIDGKIEVVDISDPLSPYLVASFAIYSENSAIDVLISGAIAYVTYHEMDSYDAGGLQILDISNPFPLPIVGSSDLSDNSYPSDMAVSGDYAYIVNELSLFEIVDVSNPAMPNALGSIDTMGSPQGVAVSGSYAYVADLWDDLQIVDISDPSAPYIASSVDTPGSPYGVAVSGLYAYVADYDGGLQIVDISDPLSATIVGSADITGWAYAVAVSGNYAYIAGHGSGSLQIVDVSDPVAPQVVGSIAMPSYAYSLSVSGSFAYVADFWSGLQIVDISDPASPYIAASLNQDGYLRDIAVSGSYAYLPSGEYTNHLLVVDISDPLTPQIVASADRLNYQRRTLVVAAAGSYAYIASSAGWTSGSLDVVQLCPDAGGISAVGLSATSLETSNNRGVDPPDQYFDVWNSGDGTLAYSISADVFWLGFDPFMGGSLGEHDTIEVSFDTSHLSPGIHAGRIIVAGPGTLNSPQYIDVTVTVFQVYHTLATGASPPEGGAVTGGGTYGFGERVTIEALPNNGWLFDHWESDDSGVDGSTLNPRSVYIDADMTATAVFVPWIALGYPLNEDAVYGPPTFRWTTQGGTNNVFSVELALSLGGPYYSTYGNLGILIKGDDWVMPYSIWNRIPHGSYIYWRVAGVDLDAEEPAVAYSTEIRWFYKP